MREWFETRLIMPFFPLAFDVFLRWLALDSILAWWQIPDLKTLSITTAFFCLLLAMDLKGIGRIPTDAEYHEKAAGIRKRFIIQGTIASIVFGAAAVLDVAEKYFSRADLSAALLPSLVGMVTVILMISVLDALIANGKYKLSYNGNTR